MRLVLHGASGPDACLILTAFGLASFRNCDVIRELLRGTGVAGSNDGKAKDARGCALCLPLGSGGKAAGGGSEITFGGEGRSLSLPPFLYPTPR